MECPVQAHPTTSFLWIILSRDYSIEFKAEFPDKRIWSAGMFYFRSGYRTARYRVTAYHRASKCYSFIGRICATFLFVEAKGKFPLFHPWYSATSSVNNWGGLQEQCKYTSPCASERIAFKPYHIWIWPICEQRAHSRNKRTGRIELQRRSAVRENSTIICNYCYYTRPSIIYHRQIAFHSEL